MFAFIDKRLLMDSINVCEK